MRFSDFEQASMEAFSTRLKIFVIIAAAAFGVLILRLWLLQVVHGPEYRVKSENNRIQLQDIPPFRGMIFDRNGELLVDNRPSFDLFLIPEDIQNRKNLAESIHRLISLDPGYVIEKLKEGSSQYGFRPIPIKRNLSRDEVAVLEASFFNLPGAAIQVKPRRFYVMNDFASHVIGYLGEINDRQLKSGRHPDGKPGDLIGQFGVERIRQKELQGMRGGEQVEVDAAGRRLAVLSRKPPIAGENLALTLDKNLQLAAQKALSGKKGAIVAINPMNGEILAMASSPSYNPNIFIEGLDRSEWSDLTTSKDFPLQNRAIQGQYPPGSIFKIVVALAGLEEGLIDPREPVFCGGIFKLGTQTFRCWRKQGHGKVDLHRALVESCDVYFYTLGRRLGVDKIAKYAKMCGLGRASGFELGSEKEGLIPTSEWKLKRFGVPWQPGETISTSIGQSFVLVTPIQMARLIGAFFNGGFLYEPRVVKWVGKEGEESYKFTPHQGAKIRAKEEHLALLRDALIGAVNEPRGTGSKCKIKEGRVAGKTGTAQVISLDKERSFGKKDAIPPELKDHAWFVALATAENPVLALAVLIENGGGGGSAAAPIAAELIRAYLGRVEGDQVVASTN
ncbi:MAG: penicillin-binding protein 2 [Deltaproteobacteria bacterium]|nr:penicillin-binding protein 2 [Deltaproteobacteria bacterium]